MLLCGLCVNSLNILFWDLRGFLPFCLSSGDPGISFQHPAQLCIQERERERKTEREGRWVSAWACTHPKLLFWVWRDLPGCYTNCTLKRWVRRQQQFQSLQNHRWSVRLEPRHTTLTGHSPTPQPPTSDCLWLGSSSQGCGLMLLLLFFVLRTRLPAKMDSCYNNKTWRAPALLCAGLYWYRGAPTTMSVHNQQPIC